MTITPVESVCIFGSAARGTSDSISDRDVLIVTRSSWRRRQLTRIWVGRGWSVAAYSPNRIQTMALRGSLFVQHLKREGIIILDNRGWLANLLSSAMPKRSYEADLRLASNMLKPLERLDLGYWSQLLAADLGFVFVRNAGIYALAEQGIYEFGYERIVRGLADIVGLTVAEIRVLQRLRAFKVAYRLRNSNLVDLGDHNALIEICAKIAQINIASTLPKNAAVRLFSVRYATLRDIEARMIMQFDVDALDHDRRDIELTSLWKMATSPREYSWAIRNIDAAWVTKANEILAQQTPGRGLISDNRVVRGLQAIEHVVE